MTAQADSEPTPGRHSLPHIPVLLSEILDALKPTNGASYIDATFGAGGYTSALLDAAACSVLALDRDPAAFQAGQTRVTHYAPRLTLVLAPFSDMTEVVAEQDLVPVDGVVFDLGVSSMQLDQAARGFSFAHNGPLDMRMFASGEGGGDTRQIEADARDRLEQGSSAADVVNTFDETDLANILFDFGEERRSRAIAKAIVQRRAEKPFETTLDLADLVVRVLGKRRGDAKHPATRTFQALRIFVNDELGELRQGLVAAEQVLKPGGRLAVVSFHSLEDRIVKRFLTERSGKTPGPSRHLPMQSIQLSEPCFRIVNSRPLTPSKGELDVNPRARSARLRIAERTNAPINPAAS